MSHLQQAGLYFYPAACSGSRYRAETKKSFHHSAIFPQLQLDESQSVRKHLYIFLSSGCFSPDPRHLLDELHHKPWQIHHWASSKPAHTRPYPSRQLSFWHSGAPKISNLDPLFHKTCVCHVALLKSLVYWNLFSFAFL